MRWCENSFHNVFKKEIVVVSLIIPSNPTLLQSVLNLTSLQKTDNLKDKNAFSNIKETSLPNVMTNEPTAASWRVRRDLLALFLSRPVTTCSVFLPCCRLWNQQLLRTGHTLVNARRRHTLSLTVHSSAQRMHTYCRHALCEANNGDCRSCPRVLWWATADVPEVKDGKTGPLCSSHPLLHLLLGVIGCASCLWPQADTVVDTQIMVAARVEMCVKGEHRKHRPQSQSPPPPLTSRELLFHADDSAESMSNPAWETKWL